MRRTLATGAEDKYRFAKRADAENRCIIHCSLNRGVQLRDLSLRGLICVGQRGRFVYGSFARPKKILRTSIANPIVIPTPIVPVTP